MIMGQLAYWPVLLACEHPDHQGCLLARVCMLKGAVLAPDLSCIYLIYAVNKSPGSDLSDPRPMLHARPVYIHHLDTSDWKAHGAPGGPHTFRRDLNITVAPWAADALRSEGFAVHLCRWMSPTNRPTHRLVLSRPNDAAFELVFHLIAGDPGGAPGPALHRV